MSDFVSLAGQLSAAYAKAVLHNPKDVVISNIERALKDCPKVVRACNAHDELVEALKAMVNAYGKYTVCPEDGSPTMLPDEHRAFELAYTALENAEGK